MENIPHQTLSPLAQVNTATICLFHLVDNVRMMIYLHLVDCRLSKHVMSQIAIHEVAWFKGL